MQYQANSPEDYLSQISEEHKEAIKKLRKTIKGNLPKGFEEGIQYGMIGYYVPLSIYPNGYHCSSKTPLPFMSLASQKKSVNLYHSGIYSKLELHNWFINEFPKHCKHKFDMGKSCIRFKKVDDIPFELIGELSAKMSVVEWIEIYEKTIKNK